MKQLLKFISVVFGILVSQSAVGQCYQNGIPCTQITSPTQTTNSITTDNGKMLIAGSTGTDTVSVLTDSDGRIFTKIYSLPSIPSGTNTIGSILNTTFGATQSGPWTVSLSGSTNVIGSISNSSFGISGTLPGFTSPPTVNLGSTNGIATETTLSAIKTLLGSPFQNGGTISNTSFGAVQSGTWNIGSISSITNPVSVTGTFWQTTQPISVAALPLPAGSATAAKQDALLTALGTPLQTGGTIGNTGFAINGSLPSGTNSLGSVSINGTVPVSGTFYQSIQPVSQSGTWTVGLPSGASTESTLSALSSKLPASLGQKTSALSVSVVQASDNIVNTVPNPSASSSVGISAGFTTSASGSITLKSSAGNLYGINAVTASTSGYLMVFNATTVPADGTVAPVKCLPISTNTGVVIPFNPPLYFNTGIVIVFSSSGCFSKTLSASAFLSGDAK